jgi:hypothetical protein
LKYEKFFIFFLSLLAAYITFNFFLDSYILNIVNLSFFI